MTTATQPVVAPATEPAKKLTYVEKLTAQANALATKINADTAKYNAIAAELASINAIQNLKAGDAVIVKTGRKFSEEKDTTQIRPGTVLGVKTDDSGKNIFKVQVGAGFDADIVTVDASAITLPAQAAAEPVATEDAQPETVAA